MAASAASRRRHCKVLKTAKGVGKGQERLRQWLLFVDSSNATNFDAATRTVDTKRFHEKSERQFHLLARVGRGRNDFKLSILEN